MDESNTTAVSPSTQAPNQTIPPKSTLNKLFYPVTLIICLLLIAALGGYSFYYLPKNQINANVSPSTFGMIAMPFDYRNPAVQNYALVYKFKVNVKDFTQTPQGVVITTTETGLPPIVVTKNTQIFKLDKAVTPTYAKLEDIIRGSELSLNNVYSPEKNEWLTSQVYIYQTSAN